MATEFGSKYGTEFGDAPMTDDLVVRDDVARLYAERAKTWGLTSGGEWDDVTNAGNLARAYLAVVAERDAWKTAYEGADKLLAVDAAQLAAMTAERDAYKLNAEMMTEWGAQLAAMTKERDQWKASHETVYRALVESNDPIVALEGKLAAMTAERDNWEHSAAQFCRNEEYYRNARDALEAQFAASEAAREHMQKVVAHAYEDLLANDEAGAQLILKHALAEPSTEGCEALKNCEEMLDVLATVGDNLRHSLLHALAERDDALWMIERINGRAQVSDDMPNDGARALSDILLICDRALAGSKRIKEDE